MRRLRSSGFARVPTFSNSCTALSATVVGRVEARAWVVAVARVVVAALPAPVAASAVRRRESRRRRQSNGSRRRGCCCSTRGWPWARKPSW
eukprot:4883236-Prymnesium_polylepis.1